jgi:hypothetical protein
MGEFDLDRYLRASKRVDLSGVAWDRVSDHVVTESEARCLAHNGAPRDGGSAIFRHARAEALESGLDPRSCARDVDRRPRLTRGSQTSGLGSR